MAGAHAHDTTFGRLWNNIQSFIAENSDLTASSPLPNLDVAAAAEKLDEYLHEVYKPENGHTDADIVFFHGLYLGKAKDAHLTTWMSSGKPPELWIQTWLVEKFPKARILTVSYDASTRRGNQEGRSDLYLIAESLFYSMIRHEIGQPGSRPVVLVGHCLGALLIKELCVFAHRATFSLSISTEREKAKNFVNNLRGVFLFAPPNLGISINEKALDRRKVSPLIDNLKLLSTSTTRLNEDFRQSCTLHNWIVEGVGESQQALETNFFGSQMDLFRAAVMVSEASARSHMDRFHQVPGDHFSICRPKDRSSSAFQALTDSIQRMLSKVPEEKFVQIALPRHAIGLEAHVKEILKRMEEAHSVGIFGMGGVGKTTLAKAVLNEIGRECEFSCFVEAKLEAKRGLSKLRKRILKSLRDSSVGQGQDGDSVISWEYFEGKRVLIVLDDIDDGEQLGTAVVPDMTHFKHGSILLATSRDANFFKDFVQYELTILDSETSRQLFCSHAFEDQPVPAHLEGYISDVVRKCDGLPLAIEVMGSYLHRKNNVEMWEDVLSRLAISEDPSGSRDRPHNLWSTLKVSYDALEDSERQMFLDLATCFYGEPLHIIKASWSTSWGSAESGLQNLISKCLVRLVEIDPVPRKRRPFHPYRAAFDAPDTKLTVWIHEQLRDLGQTLVTRPPPSRTLLPTEKWSRVWRQEDAEELLEGIREQHPPETVGLVFKSFSASSMDLAASLVKMKELKFLLFEPSVCDAELPPNVALLRSNMQSGHPSSSLQRLAKLAVLELYGCSDPESVLRYTGKLTQLRVLTVRRSCTYRYSEDLGTAIFPQHEGVKICPALRCRRLPEELGQLKALQYLTVDVDGFEELPDSFGDLSRLSYCRLSCDSLVRLPDNFGLLTSLTELILLDCRKLSSLPVTFGNLPKLERLIVNKCHSLTSLPESFGRLLTLKSLNCWWSFQAFPQSFGNLSGLQSLFCDVESLPDTFGDLVRLRELELLCPELRVLPESFGQLRSLKHITVEMSSIQTLPDSFGSLSALEKLSFYSCQNLTSLPESFGQLHSLKFLRFHECFLLSYLPESFGNLVVLEKLHFYACPMVYILPQSFVELKSLRELYFRECSIETLPSDFGQLEALDKLQFARCKMLNVLPERFGPLKSLRRVDFIYCPIQAIPSADEDLNRLEKMKVSYCYKLTTPLESFGQLKSLKRLDFSCCSITTGSGSFEGLCKLEQLKLASCSEVSVIPDSFGLLRSLKHLEITDCPIETLPESFGNLAALRILLITKCKKLSSLPDTFGNLKSLTRLRLDQCPVTSLPASFGMLSTLEELIIVKCNNLMTIPDSFGGLCALKQFTFGESSMEALPDVFRDLRALEELNLIECSNLKNLPESLRWLTLTQRIQINNYDCPLQGIENFGRGFVEAGRLSLRRSSLSRVWSWSDVDS